MTVDADQQEKLVGRAYVIQWVSLVMPPVFVVWLIYLLKHGRDDLDHRDIHARRRVGAVCAVASVSTPARNDTIHAAGSDGSAFSVATLSARRRRN